MPSPFPGMDPYLEAPAFWPDFHATFINYCRETIADLLPETYEARLGERVNLVAISGASAKLVYPDVAVTKRQGRKRSGKRGATLTLEPVTVRLPVMEELRQSRIEVLHRPERKLVTVVEVLSPSNKAVSRDDYLSKREAVLSRRVNLVEVDLLIGGERMPTLDPLPAGDYYVLIARADRQRPVCEVYPWTVRAPLPTIPVPLKSPDADIMVNLASVFATAYERGRYARSLDYRTALALPLAAEDLRWAATRAKGSTRT